MLLVKAIIKKNLKAYARLKLRITTLGILFLILLPIIYNSNNKLLLQSSKPQNSTTETTSASQPVLLKIPAINVDAAIEPVGLTPDREMRLPENSLNVGWYYLGTRPGEKGSAVVAGHFNTENGDAGVFFNLYKLKIGDKIFIKNDRGTDIIFVVKGSQLFDSGLAGEVFSLNDGIAHLNLITCDGAWDGVKKSYTKRLVIFADLF